MRHMVLSIFVCGLILCSLTSVAANDAAFSPRQLAGVRGKQRVQIYKTPTASAFSSDWTPIRVRLGKDFNSSTVTLCKLNWAKRSEVCKGEDIAQAEVSV